MLSSTVGHLEIPPGLGVEVCSGDKEWNGSQELLELIKEKEEFRRKVSELEKEAEEAEIVDMTLT